MSREVSSVELAVFVYFIAVGVMNFFVARPKARLRSMCNGWCDCYGLSWPQRFFVMGLDVPTYHFVAFYACLSTIWAFNRGVHIIGNGFDSTEAMVLTSLVAGIVASLVLFCFPAQIWMFLVIFVLVNVYASATWASSEGTCTDPSCFTVKLVVVVAVAFVLTTPACLLASCCKTYTGDLHRYLSCGCAAVLPVALTVDGVDGHFNKGWTDGSYFVYLTMIPCMAVLKYAWDQKIIGCVRDPDRCASRYRRTPLCCICFIGAEWDTDGEERKDEEEEEEQEQEQEREERALTVVDRSSEE